MCGLQSPGTLTQDIDQNLIKERILPELENAGRYWVQHYCENGMRLDDGSQSIRSPEDCFLHWLELMRLTGYISEVAGMIRLYEALLVVSV